MLLSIQKVKETYNISRSTLINWEKEGLITPIRTPKGRRRYKKEGEDVITMQAKLTFPSKEDEQRVLDLMRRWSSCMRYAYNRLLEGSSRNTLKGEGF
ncbi:transposase, putative, N-terminal domain-containing protein [Caldicoprobacter faecalis]|uniref:Transposase, putative, N-terminal domain-containing protein n=1 Tax=Caldicoprobacter faecalis TaxID=937334 RepID=A0A1I5UC80_9FIRM|nr:transposase, putative, N-terminal domain-containing protein [Caldicoprobacter faecalis]